MCSKSAGYIHLEKNCCGTKHPVTEPNYPTRNIQIHPNKIYSESQCTVVKDEWKELCLEIGLSFVTYPWSYYEMCRLNYRT
jgi:hypothetical protein